MFPQIERTKTTFTRYAESSKKKKKRNIKLRERENASIYHFANFIGQKKKTWKYSRRSGPLFLLYLINTAKKNRF